MSIIPTTLTLAGLALSVLGALVCAVNLRPRPFLDDPRAQSSRMDLIHSARRWRVMGYDEPAYTPQLVAVKHKEADDALAREVDKFQRDLSSHLHAHERKMQRQTLWGLLAVAGGSALQALAVLLS